MADETPGDDTPSEVWAALRAAHDLTPLGLPDVAGRAAWWDAHATAYEVAAQAFDRLHVWAVATGKTPAELAAIGEAAAAKREKARDCRSDARRAREEQRAGGAGSS